MHPLKGRAALPFYFFFTNRHQFNDILLVINSLPSNSGVIVREYDLSKEERLEFATRVLAITKRKKLLCLIGKDLELALKLKADGLHFSDLDYLPSNCLNYKKTTKGAFLFTYSCHSFASLKQAEKLKFNAAFYSPVFPTTSHPKAKAKGLLNLAKVTSQLKIPVYALGGIKSENILRLKACSIAGIAGITLFDHEKN